MECLASCVAYIIAAIRYEYSSGRRRRSGRSGRRRVKYEYKARRRRQAIIATQME